MRKEYYESQRYYGAASGISDLNVRKLLVLDESGKVSGTLYERDVFFAIVKAMVECQLKEG